MDKRNAFERQIADEIEYEVGPPRNVDALAITRQARTTSPRWRFSSMSSTIKFAATTVALAAAGVALFLIAPLGPAPDEGVVAPPGAEQQSPSPSPEGSPAAEEPTGSATDTTPQDEGADALAPATFAWSGVEDTEHGFIIEAVDARASGEMTLGDGPVMKTDANFIGTWESRLVNDDGAWVGTGREISGRTFDPTGGDWQQGEFDTEWEVTIAMWEMTGEGDYDGLNLILFTEYDEDLVVPHPASWGLIFPSDSISE